MFIKRNMTMEMCSLISLILIFICIVNVNNVQLVKLNGNSLQKAWSKSASQPFRHIRGFRPETLSTARGFGKRANFDSQQYSNNPNNLINPYERLRLAENQFNKDNLNELLLKDYLANLLKENANRNELLNLNNNRKITFDSAENLRNSKGVNEDEIGNNLY